MAWSGRKATACASEQSAGEVLSGIEDEISVRRSCAYLTLEVLEALGIERELVRDGGRPRGPTLRKHWYTATDWAGLTPRALSGSGKAEIGGTDRAGCTWAAHYDVVVAGVESRNVG